MKTNVEISEWLKTQPWFPNFVNNFNRVENDVKESSFEKDFLSGNLGDGTLLEAFNWAESPEGYLFWCDANRELMKFLGK